MTRPAPPLLGSFDRFDDRLIQWIADAAGLWLRVNDDSAYGGVLSAHAVEDLSGFHPDDLEISYVDGVGYRYGLPGMRPILPFPFTAMQLFEFDKQAGDLVRCNFYIDAKEAEEQLIELEQTNPEAAELARIIFSGVMPEQQPITPSPAPVAAEGASGSMETPDAERRLAQLRALGGTVKCVNYEWKFTGTADLVKREKEDGRKRCSEKTIRADLMKAAQAEQEAKSAGFQTGLGQH